MKNPPTITTVLYDVDGVISNRLMIFSQVLDSKYGLPLAKTLDFFRGPFQDCLVGKLDMAEVLPDYLKKWNWPGTYEDFTKLWFTSEHSIEVDMIEHVDQLRSVGIKCYVATNQEKHRANYMLEEMGFKNHFDKLFVSAHLGLAKPNLTFFNKILDQLKLKPSEVIFWDDDNENIKAALELGINAELFTDIAGYHKIMTEKYGL